MLTEATQFMTGRGIDVRIVFVMITISRLREFLKSRLAIAARLLYTTVGQWGLLLLFVLFLVVCPLARNATAIEVEQVINPQQQYGGWVTDMADVLSQETEQALNQKISALESENGSEIAVVTVPDTASEATPKEFATRLFNHWGIGKADVDNGVLWLHSVGDRRVEIETGYGVEGMLPDARVGRIINELVIPEFKNDEFDGGTLAGVDALVTILSDKAFEFAEDSGAINAFGGFGAITLVCWAISGLGYQRIRRRLMEPIKLAPKGNSRVMGQGEYTRYRGTFRSTIVYGFTLAMAIVLTAILLDSSYRLPIVIICIYFGVSLVQAIAEMSRFLAGESSDVPVIVFWGLIVTVPIVIVLVSIALAPTMLGNVLEQFLAHISGAFLANILVVSSLASLSIAWFIYEILKQWFDKDINLICECCDTELQWVEDSQVAEALNHSQNVAKDLESTSFKGLSCPKCSPQLSDFHLRSYILDRNQFQECPKCHEFTVTRRSETTVRPSYSSAGRRETHYRCQACDEHWSEITVLPKWTRLSGSYGSSGISGGGGFSGGGGGGGFGGGGSGGGGAGGSY